MLIYLFLLLGLNEIGSRPVCLKCHYNFQILLQMAADCVNDETHQWKIVTEIVLQNFQLTTNLIAIRQIGVSSPDLMLYFITVGGHVTTTREVQNCTGLIISRKLGHIEYAAPTPLSLKYCTASADGPDIVGGNQFYLNSAIMPSSGPEFRRDTSPRLRHISNRKSKVWKAIGFYRNFQYFIF